MFSARVSGSHGPRVLALALAMVMTFSAWTRERDLRDEYGTRNLQAATLFRKGLTHSQNKQHREALEAFAGAAKLDPTFILARYWMAIAQGDMGDIDAAIESYKQVVRLGKEHGITNVVVDGAVNLALTYARIKKETDASHWFTEAILLDPKDTHKLHWKAYRNMSIGLNEQRKHLSSAMCVVLAYQANPERVGVDMVLEYIERAGAEEVGQILHFPGTPVEVADRPAAPQLREGMVLPAIAGKVSDVLVDVPGNRVVAIVKDAQHFCVINNATSTASKRIQVGRVIKAGGLTAGELFLSLDGPAAIARVDLATGKIQAEWKLPHAAPASLAPLPAQGVVCYPARGFIQVLNLSDGSSEDSQYFSTGVRADPRQRFCFSYIHPGVRETTGHVLINGRPVFFQCRHRDWAQTALFQYALASHKMLTTAFRLNAASNGRVLHVSPDGEWAAIAGGGGWRPEVPVGEKGYGVAVVRARDLSCVQGFYVTEAYPRGVAVNHITCHVVVWRDGDGRIYPMARPKDAVKFKGQFSDAATWSADGRRLYMAGKEKGLLVYELQLTPEERRRAAAFPAQLAKTYPERLATKTADVSEMAGLDQFKIEGSRAGVLGVLKRIPREGRTVKPVDWSRHAPFFKTENQKQELLEAFKGSRSRDVGITIYNLKGMLKKEPNHPVVHHLLGMANYFNKQLPEAEAYQVKAIRLDRGRTNVTTEALRMLSFLKMREQKHLEAAYCYSHVLLLDKANPGWLKEARPFYERANLIADADAVLKAGQTMALPGGGVTVKGDLPALEIRSADRRYAADQLYKNAVPSVVLIQAGASKGSGVCVGGRGWILTNHHVIRQAGGAIKVYPYAHSAGVLKRLAPLDAEVVLRAPEQDIAVLRVADPPATLQPLPVAAADPAVGIRVYALGSPGMGMRVLEQSMTDGIVSAAGREIEGQRYIQHTAAVNPGNSGGPLMDERGQIVGINTIKASLEGVSFAIPASRVRACFKKR